MKVLVVKTSSMGDIIHTLPALTDALQAFPDIRFDWVVENSFQEIPRWHAACDRIIPIALRQWRHQPLEALRSRQVQQAVTALRAEQYDYVIDAQGLIKSAIISRLARGVRCGLNWTSAREPIASLLYQYRCYVPRAQHAVTRTRQLFAKVIGYAEPVSLPDYGVVRQRLPEVASRGDYLMFFHGTTWDNKHWPEEYWCQLVELANHAGLTVLLPWGNTAEHQRAQRIASAGSAVEILPRLSLSELASVISHAQGVIALDTGLGHLAASLDVLTIGLYGPTNPSFSSNYGKNQYQLKADFACAPCMRRVCQYRGMSAVQPACFATIPPVVVWQKYLKERYKDSKNASGAGILEERWCSVC